MTTMDPNRDPNVPPTMMHQLSGTASSTLPSTMPCNKNKKSLGLLAEVAMKRIYEEQLQHNNDNQQQTTAEQQPKTRIINQRFSLEQIRKLSEKRMLNIFSEFKKDLKNKIYSYKCQILPQECQLMFECYNNETEAKNRIIDHLSSHLSMLEKTLPDVKIYSSRKAKIRNKVKTENKDKVKTTTTKKATTTTKMPKNTNKKSKSIEDKNQSSTVVPTTTTNVSSISAVDMKIENDTKNNLALKLLAADHAYTQQLIAASSAGAVVNLKTEAVDNDEDVKDDKLAKPLIKQEDHQMTKPELMDTLARKSAIVSTISMNVTNNQNQNNNLPLQLTMPHQQTQIKVEDDLVISDTMMGTVSQTVEIRTTPYCVPSSPVPPPQPKPATSVVHHQMPSTQTTTTTLPTDSVPAATMRNLALDYIDDIRRKSSSAAKSIIVNGDKSIIYQCKICPDKQFTSTNGLIFHYKKHAGLKPYVCELCSATFTRQHSLNYHMLIHLNKSRFVCPECGRHFRHPSHFKEHMRRHTGETPFQCSDCLIRFKTRNTYKRHLQTKHAKILTSKGIIELSSASSIPYQSNVPKSSAGSTGASSSSSSASATTAVKPRRKYAIGYLHKNIETMSKYEQEQTTTSLQQQQHHEQHQLQVSYPLKQMSLGSHMETLDPVTLTGLAIPTSIGPNGITILSIPPHQTMNSVHILDNNINSSHGNYVRIQKPLVDLTDNVPIFQTQQQHAVTQQGGHMTLVSYQPAPGQTNLTGVAMAHNNQLQQHLSLKPMEPVACISGTSELSSGKLTKSPSQDNNSSSSASTNLTELTSVSLIGDGNGKTTTTIQQMQAQPVSTIVSSHQPTTTTNDNFMRLLEAIAMTEVSTPN